MKMNENNSVHVIDQILNKKDESVVTEKGKKKVKKMMKKRTTINRIVRK